MPVAASSISAAASPHDHDTVGAGPPSPLARSGPGPDDDAEILDVEMLVAGYLSSVAAALRDRGIAVRTVHLDDLGPGVLCGTLNLRPVGIDHGPGWGPTQVDWHQDTGWSARLRRGINGHLTIWRYLHAATVPTPVAVAGFVAALAAGDDVGMATPVRFTGRRQTLLTRLARFAVPGPCAPVRR